jgi:hypothetical protein
VVVVVVVVLFKNALLTFVLSSLPLGIRGALEATGCSCTSSSFNKKSKSKLSTKKTAKKKICTGNRIIEDTKELNYHCGWQALYKHPIGVQSGGVMALAHA